MEPKLPTAPPLHHSMRPVRPGDENALRPPVSIASKVKPAERVGPAGFGCEKSSYGSDRILARSAWYFSGVIASLRYRCSNSCKRDSLEAEIPNSGALSGGRFSRLLAFLAGCSLGTIACSGGTIARSGGKDVNFSRSASRAFSASESGAEGRTNCAYLPSDASGVKAGTG